MLYERELVWTLSISASCRFHRQDEFVLDEERGQRKGWIGGKTGLGMKLYYGRDTLEILEG